MARPVTDQSSPKPPRDRYEIRARCTRFLSRQRAPSPKEALQALADHVGADERPDMYGKGRIIEDFERDIAQLLGKPAAVLMPSGTMVQAISVRVWCDRRGARTVGLHPLTHIERNESQAYRTLHGLGACYLGDDSRQFSRKDLEAVSETLGAIVLEMPLRPLGCVLLPWEELEALSRLAREREIPLHLDGARIWESQPFYGRSLAEIAALFDSVYVSFYKGLGGIAGAALAGPKDFIDEARLWQHRQGGRLFQLYPYALAARAGLAERLPLMDAHYREIRRIADVLRALPGVRVTPDPPQATSMLVALPAAHDRIETAMLDLAEETGIWLIDRVFASPIQGLSLAELTAGTGAAEFSDGEIRSLFERVLARVA
jgi:threonine aldolase